MTTPKTSEKPAKPADKTPPKLDAKRAVVKPGDKKPESAVIPWEGGVDRFDERV